MDVLRVSSESRNLERSELILISPQFKNSLLIYGLPGIGKSLELAYMQNKRDDHRDLCLNLYKNCDIDGIKYTVDYLRVRGQNNLRAYQIPDACPFAQNRALKLYKLTHPQLKRILIDEVEDWPYKDISNLCKILLKLFPAHQVVLSGVLFDTHNKPFKTTLKLMEHCHFININPQCHFCNNKAKYMLNVYQGHKVTYDQLSKLSKAGRDYIKEHMKRYHVCPYHYLRSPYPNMKL